MSRGPDDSEFTFEVIEAGKRAADHINLHMVVNPRDEIRDKWLAIKLEDGSSDGVMYDTAPDAVRHQRFEQQCWYVCFRGINPGGFTAKDCSIMIMHYRKAYAAGLRFVDPDNRVRVPVMSSQRYDIYDEIVKQRAIELMSNKYGRDLRR